MMRMLRMLQVEVVSKVVHSGRSPSIQPKRTARTSLLVLVGLLFMLVPNTIGFSSVHRTNVASHKNAQSIMPSFIFDERRRQQRLTRTSRRMTIPTNKGLNLFPKKNDVQDPSVAASGWQQRMSHALAVGLVSAALLIGSSMPALAENELSAKYGGGLDTSLVDQQCLLTKCNLQAKACLQDDASCRKGLTCTAKCLGDNSCITGCMARYGNEHLDQFLKCTIEDNECIKVAILPGGFDATPPAPPAPVLTAFDPKSMTGSWFKVMGFNPNYDCYAHQRNSFAVSSRQPHSLEVDVEFSMPRLLPDGIVHPVSITNTAAILPENMALNSYTTHELMVFDDNKDPNGRSAHSHGEMFGLRK
jgi:VDE lipocalin domain